jgi:hypothetical protein
MSYLITAEVMSYLITAEVMSYLITAEVMSSDYSRRYVISTKIVKEKA